MNTWTKSENEYVPWTIKRIKEELPSIAVQEGKDIVIGQVRGRKNKFAAVVTEFGSYEVAWETITRIRNNQSCLRT